MLCTAELQNTAEIEDSDFNYEMRNISLIYTNDIMPLPVSLTKICKFDLTDRSNPEAVMDLCKAVLGLHDYINRFQIGIKNNVYRYKTTLEQILCGF